NPGTPMSILARKRWFHLSSSPDASVASGTPYTFQRLGARPQGQTCAVLAEEE
ncbi:Hypothetical protein FKW44_018066, partial [Caligus rogercresseyi]